MAYRARTSSRFLALLVGVVGIAASYAGADASVTGDSEDIPQYLQLAFVPERNTSLFELPAGYWTVQALALSSKEALEAFAREHKLQGMTAARVAQDGKLFYILLLGIYETRERAQRAIENVPPPFADLNLWIRSLGSLQSAMTAANSLSGSEAF